LVLAGGVQLGPGESLQCFTQTFGRLAPEILLEEAARRRGAEVWRDGEQMQGAAAAQHSKTNPDP